MKADLRRRLAAEFTGTAFLLASVVGSGIMAERLAGGNAALALLANTIATGAALFVLILALAPVSGAHFNPAVTVSVFADRRSGFGETIAYVASQLVGAVCGVLVANTMFGLPPVVLSQKARNGSGQWLGESVATFGLVFMIAASARYRSLFAVPMAVATYISAAYWFTSSTSFANPAVTIARSLSDTFAGIMPADVPMFVVAQMVGGAAAYVFSRWLFTGTEGDI